MTLKVRRVVTGLDANGHSIVKMDAVMRNLASRRAGQSECEVWSTVSKAPSDGPNDTERALQNADSEIASGTVLRMVEYAPGVASFPHKNTWIDYTIVISGEIDMQLEDGVEIHLQAGDVVVQRGAVHNWINRGTKHSTIAFVRVGAKSEA